MRLDWTGGGASQANIAVLGDKGRTGNMETRGGWMALGVRLVEYI